jgi:hypothetical protein
MKEEIPFQSFNAGRKESMGHRNYKTHVRFFVASSNNFSITLISFQNFEPDY